jgi:hypothetical protein
MMFMSSILPLAFTVITNFFVVRKLLKGSFWHFPFLIGVAQAFFQNLTVFVFCAANRQVCCSMVPRVALVH